MALPKHRLPETGAWIETRWVRCALSASLASPHGFKQLYVPSH